MDKNHIKNIINFKNNKFLSEKKFKNKFSDEYNCIYNETLFLKNPTFSERKYCFLHDIKEIPECPVCHKLLKFRDFYYGYGITCSNKCKAIYSDKLHSIDLKKIIYSKVSKSIKNTILNRSKEEKQYISNKFILFHKNMDPVKKLLRNKKISLNSKIERSLRDNFKKEMIIKKRLHTMKNKSLEDIEKIKKKISLNVQKSMNKKSKQEWNIICNKQYMTKKKNNSFNISKPEKIIESKLKEIFNNIHKQYKSKKYPFNCDFYIEDIDLYIEINFHWTHGYKPFNNTEEDKFFLKKWLNKSKNSKFYKKAILIWTQKDVVKRQTALNNKLNWIEFFNMEQFNKWINEYK